MSSLLGLPVVLVDVIVVWVDAVVVEGTRIVHTVPDVAGNTFHCAIEEVASIFEQHLDGGLARM